MDLTPSLVSAARALAKIDREQLAAKAGLEVDTLEQFEDGLSGLDAAGLDHLRQAIEHFGVEFLPPNDSGPGLRLRFNEQETGQLLGWEGEGGLPGEDDVP
ncbi:MAG: XRE family transcriptional regulator [Rhizobium sp.]|nr:XRE family transcriptional regulator [Rhizobium sp.]